MKILPDSKYNLDLFYNFPYLFHQEYKSFCYGLKQKYLIITNKEETVFMPVTVVKSQFLTILTILYPPLNENGKLKQEKENYFLEKFITFCSNQKLCDRINPPMILDNFNSYPKKSIFKELGQINLNIENKTEGDIFKGFKSNYRNEIKKCIKEGAIVKFGVDQFDKFYDLFSETLSRQDLVVDPYENVKLLFEELNKKKSVICGVVYHNDLAQGSVLIPLSNYSAYYLYGGSIQQTSLNGLMKLLHWEVIKILVEKKVKAYSYGAARLDDIKGTKHEGIQNFKIRFGCQLNKGYIWKKDINIFKCKIYDILYYLKYDVLKRNKSTSIFE